MKKKEQDSFSFTCRPLRTLALPFGQPFVPSFLGVSHCLIYKNVKDYVCHTKWSCPANKYK